MEFINFLMELEEKTSAGCIVLSDESVLIVKNKKISCSFPKGHIKEGESYFDCAQRELFEETGLCVKDLEFVKDLGFIERLDGYSKTTKKIYYFLFYTDKEKELGGLDEDNEAYWVKRGKAEEILSYEEERDLFRRFCSSFFY
ncbi:MAG: NUDIX domain-containing protein [Candidatus Nanoarchaeia archaeon]